MYHHKFNHTSIHVLKDMTRVGDMTLMYIHLDLCLHIYHTIYLCINIHRYIPIYIYISIPNVFLYIYIPSCGYIYIYIIYTYSHICIPSCRQIYISIRILHTHTYMVFGHIFIMSCKGVLLFYIYKSIYIQVYRQAYYSLSISM